MILTGPILPGTSEGKHAANHRESKPGPPGNCAPSFDAHQPGDLLMHLEGSEQVPDVQRHTYAGSEPVESQSPFWNVAGVGGGSVVIVPEGGNLRFGVGGHRAIF